MKARAAAPMPMPPGGVRMRVGSSGLAPTTAPRREQRTRHAPPPQHPHPSHAPGPTTAMRRLSSTPLGTRECHEQAVAAGVPGPGGRGIRYSDASADANGRRPTGTHDAEVTVGVKWLTRAPAPTHW